MNKDIITSALEAQIAFQDEQAREAISGKTKAELIAFAKEYLSKTSRSPKLGFLHKLFLDFIVHGEAPEESIKIADGDGHAYQALRQVVRRLRQNSKDTPQEIKDYILDVELGVRKRPRKTGATTIQRNEKIRECIDYIARFSGRHVSRNDETKHRDCVIEIVAEAVPLGYHQVKDIWQDRNKE